MIHISVPKVEITEEEAVKILLHEAYSKNQFYEDMKEQEENGEVDEFEAGSEIEKETKDATYEALFALCPEYKDPEKLQEAFKNIENE